MQVNGGVSRKVAYRREETVNALRDMGPSATLLTSIISVSEPLLPCSDPLIDPVAQFGNLAVQPRQFLSRFS